jgi:hypothetical protein
MHFGRVKVGDRYSVSPEATLGPTPREIDERLASDKLESKRIASQRIQEFESRQFDGSRVDGSRVREFESSSSTVV